MDHTYDRNFLIKYIEGLQTDLKSIVKPHLTEKSLGRIDLVLDFFSTADFLDSLYVPDKNNNVAKQMSTLMDLLSKCMEEGVL